MGRKWQHSLCWWIISGNPLVTLGPLLRGKLSQTERIPLGYTWGCPWGHTLHSLPAAPPGKCSETQGEPGEEISQAIRQIYLDIALLKRQKWPEMREIRDAAIISILWEFHINHTQHTRGLLTFSVGRRHQFNQAKGTNTINRGNSVMAKSPWLRAMLSTRLWILAQHQQHSWCDWEQSPGHAHSPRWMWTKAAQTGCPGSPRHPAQPKGTSAAGGAVVSSPSRGDALCSLSPMNCTGPAVLGHTKVSCPQAQWKPWAEISRKKKNKEKEAGLCQSTH